jgi:phycobilisome rod-core linker protein
VAIPLLEYKPSSQNQRVKGFEVAGDEQYRIYSTENILSPSDLDNLIEAAYRQIFFHAFASDRERFLESQLRSGQITVRDFIRGLLLSNTYKNSFYNLNSNYRFVEQTVQRVLGRAVYNNAEKLAWSITVATKGMQGFVDQLLGSDEYNEAFGYDVVPYQRRRVLPGRAEGERPFNISSPRYGEYHRRILGFPKPVWQSSVRTFVPQEKKPSAGSPANFLEMARNVGATGATAQSLSAQNIDIARSVPYRKLDYANQG